MAKAKPPKTGANYTGSILEKFVRDRLTERGYKFVERANFAPERYLEKPIFTEHYRVGQSIYDTPLFCDYILYHPTKHPDNLIIDAKWQQVGGSVDEKYPFLVLNIKYKYPCRTALILDGKGYKPSAEKWLRDQVGDNLIAVYNMAQFNMWANNGGI